MLSKLSSLELFDALPEPVVLVDEHACIRALNPRAEQLFDTTQSALAGLHVSTLIQSKRLEHVSGTQLLDALCIPVTSHSHISNADTYGCRRNGERFPVELSANTLEFEQSILCVITVHDRSAQQAERDATQQLWRAHMPSQCADIGVVRLSADGRVTRMNEAWRRYVERNRAHDPACVDVGEDYLAACERSERPWGPRVAAGIRAVLSGEKESFAYFYSCHAPHKLRWLRLDARLTSSPGSEVVLTLLDSTCQQLNQVLSHIQGCVAHTFVARTSLVSSCRELSRLLCQELAWDYIAIWTPDSPTWQLRCEEVWTRPELGLQAFENRIRTQRLSPEAGLPGRVWSTRQAQWVNDRCDDNGVGRLSPDRAEMGFRSGFAFAVKYDDDVLAVVEILGRLSLAPDWELLALLGVAGVQLAAGELRERAELRATAARAEADDAREQLEALLACVPALVIAVDRSGTLRFVNRDNQYIPSLPDPLSWRTFIPEAAQPALEAALTGVLNGGSAQSHEASITDAEGDTTWFTHYLAPIRSGSSIAGALIVARDITQTKKARQELFHAQRLASIGTLTAGVAHEINTPVQFVGDSLEFLRDAHSEVGRLVSKLLELRENVEQNADRTALQHLIEETYQLEEQADLEYLAEHVPGAFARCSDGLDRVTSIVRSMKEFSHPAQKEMTATDLNRTVMTTLTVARNEYKYVADVVTQLGELPPVMCHTNDINQVILNIVVNAAHAIGDLKGDSEQKGVITVRTYVEGRHAVIAITDTGGGIPEAHRDRVFDPFFTTKVVGRGTGQGLAIAWSTIRERHMGELTFESECGVGTTFFIRLPLQDAELLAKQTAALRAS